MSMGATELRLVLKAHDEASKVVRGLGSESSKMGKALKTAQLGAAAGFAALSGVIATGVKTYENLGSAVSKLTKLTDISAESASQLVGQWQRYGIGSDQGSKALIMLSKQIEAAEGGTKKSVRAFKSLGISMADLKSMSADQVMEKMRDALSKMGPGAERTSLMLQLMGKSGTSMLNWVNAAPGDIGKLNQMLNETGQVMSGENLAAYKKNAKAQAEMSLQWRGFLITVGQSVMPWLEKLVGVLSKVTGALTPLGPIILPLAAALGGFLVISKIVSTALPLVTLLQNLGVFTKIAAAAQWAWNAAMSANPIGLIVIAIAALVAIFVVLWNKCDWFRNFWIGLWEKIKGAAEVVWPVIKGIIDAIVDALGSAWDWIRPKIEAFWDWAGPYITLAVQVWWQQIKTTFEIIKTVIETAWPIIVGIVTGFIDAVRKVIHGIGDVVDWLRTNVWDRIQAVIEEVWPIIKGVIQRHIDAVKAVIEGIKDVVEFVRGVWDKIKAAAEEVWGLIKDLVRDRIEDVKTIVSGISAVVGFVRDAFNSAKDKVEEIGGKIKDAVEGVWTAIHDTADTWWGKITGVVSSAWDSIAGFINKIIRGINWVLEKVPGLGSVDRIPELPTGGGGKSISDLAEQFGGGSNTTPTVPTPAIMDNGGMGGPEAQGSDAGKGGSGAGGRGGLGSGTADWVVDLWNKVGISAQLPQPVGGLFGGATDWLLGLGKEAIVGLLTKFADRGDRNKIVEFAKSMLGVPYVWGGTSPAGFDCSGLLYWAYQQAGIKDFPRIPTYGGKQIGYSDIQPADVLFYYPNAVQDGRTVPFGHFKMYAGGGQTIESTSGGVQMRPVQSDYAQIRSYLRLGGITRGLSIAGEGGPMHPEAVVPLTNPRRGAAVLAAAGLLPRGGDVLTINVDARGSSNVAATEAAAERGARRALVMLAEKRREAVR